MSTPGSARCAAAVVAGCCAAALAAQPWRNYGRDPQHSAVAATAAQPLEAIRWSAPVDLAPQYSDEGTLDIHYGSPLVTRHNTVVFPVKTGAAGGFRVEARHGGTGSFSWEFDTDYVLPPHAWIPSCGACLASGDRVVVPAAGGTLLVRKRPERAGPRPRRIAFYGLANYEAQKEALDRRVFICTPVTSDAKGNVYFGFLADALAPMGLVSGFARISRAGRATTVAAATASGDAALTRPAMNAAPALSRDGRTLYVAVRDASGAGCLCALDARSLARRASIRLMDPLVPDDEAFVSDDATASPTIGPDGDVFFGVLEGGSSFNYRRGWLLHFDAALSTTKTPGSFGWDDTASIVPASAVPSYQGGSAYLVLTKYNEYAGVGGSGINRLAVLDPNAAQTDERTGATVIGEVLTIAAPTPDPEYGGAGSPGAVREWCINTAAVDPESRCAFVNNEDGVLYRWDFATNTLSQSVVLTQGAGSAYTPTVLGPDGTVYAISDATLFAVGRALAR